MRAHPPDVDPAAFQAARAAYEVLRTARARVRRRLLDDPDLPNTQDVLERILAEPAPQVDQTVQHLAWAVMVRAAFGLPRDPRQAFEPLAGESSAKAAGQAPERR